MMRRPPRSTRKESSAASDVYKRQKVSSFPLLVYSHKLHRSSPTRLTIVLRYRTSKSHRIVITFLVIDLICLASTRHHTQQCIALSTVELVRHIMTRGRITHPPRADEFGNWACRTRGYWCKQNKRRASDASTERYRRDLPKETFSVEFVRPLRRVRGERRF